MNMTQMYQYTNPKNNETIESRLNCADAAEILKNETQEFPASLVSKYQSGRTLSPAQIFWLIKLADQKTVGKDIQPIHLESDLSELLQKTGRVMWKVEGHARIKLYWNEENKHIKVFMSGGDQTRYAGYINRDQFIPHNRTMVGIVSAQLRVFSENPKEFLMLMGKRWGKCCICGRELENETSVRLGIGPICLGRSGL